MNSETKLAGVLDDGAALFQGQHVKAVGQPSGSGLGQLADALKTKTAEEMAEVLLADEQLLDELLGP